MSEPDIIRSDRQHEVTIPEGSNKALAKTAAQQEPSVRKVLNEGGGEIIEHILPDKFVSDTTPALQSRPDNNISADKPAKTQGLVDAAATSQVSVPAPSSMGTHTAAAPPSRDEATPTSPGAQASGPASESFGEDRVLPKATATAPSFPAMPEMDFPARIVHLRIENELLQKRLDELDKDT